MFILLYLFLIFIYLYCYYILFIILTWVKNTFSLLTEHHTSVMGVAINSHTKNNLRSWNPGRGLKSKGHEIHVVGVYWL